MFRSKEEKNNNKKFGAKLKFSNLLIAVCGIMNFLPDIFKCFHSLRYLFETTINFT